MRFTRTSRKEYIRQLAWIERRQTRIRRIREASKAAVVPAEVVPTIPDEHYNIGKSQHLPVNLNSFVQKNMDDPAVTVGVTNLRVFWKSFRDFLGLHPEVKTASPSPYFGDARLHPGVEQHVRPVDN